MSLCRNLRSSARSFPTHSPDGVLKDIFSSDAPTKRGSLELGRSIGSKSLSRGASESIAPGESSAEQTPTRKKPRYTRQHSPQKKDLDDHSPDKHFRSNETPRRLSPNQNVPLDRPAQPKRTNAPLRTPRGSRVVAYTKETASSSPFKSCVPRPSTTTSHVLDQACEFLIMTEPRLKPLVEKYHCHIFSPEGLAEAVDPFQSLCSGIMSQQVSGAAAKSIKQKFIGLFPQDSNENGSNGSQAFPQPQQVASCDIAFLRQAGLSQRKAEYIKGLAEKFVSGDLTVDWLVKAEDDEVLEKLTAVRGLGKCT